MKHFKRFVAGVMAFTLLFSHVVVAAPEISRPGGGIQPGVITDGELLSEASAYFSEAGRLSQEKWDDNFFGEMIFTIGSPYVMIDRVRVLINQESRITPEIINGIPMLPICILAERAGVEPSVVTAGIDMSYEAGQADMVDILDIPEYLGYAIEWNPITREIRVRRPFQMMRLIALPTSDIDFYSLSPTHVVPWWLDMVVLQFATVADTMAAYRHLSSLQGEKLEWVETESFITHISMSTYEQERVRARIAEEEYLQNRILTEAYYYFSEASRLSQEKWDDNFFGEMIFTVGSPYVVIDGEQMLIDQESRIEPSLVNGVPMLPMDILAERAGVETSFMSETASMAEETSLSMRNGTGYSKMANIRSLPDCLGYVTEWNPETNVIRVTRPFQMMRLIVLPTSEIDFYSLGATHVIPWWSDMIVLQFATVANTMAAYEHLSLLQGEKLEWVEPDLFITQIRPMTEYNLENVMAEISPFQQSAHRSWGVPRTGVELYAQHVRSNGLNRRIDVAVLDTGVEPTHSFLQGRILPGVCFVTSTNITRDTFGLHGHGTPVAGIIVDSTPNLDVRILPVRVFNPHSTTVSVTDGIRFASTRAQVINMSIGAGGADQNTLRREMNNAVNNHNVVIVVASGNDGINAALFAPENLTNVITVSASNSADRAWINSHWGVPVDLAAPGVDIISLSRNGIFRPETGTSFAAPHVAGAAAMYRLVNPFLDPVHVQAALSRYVNTPPGWRDDMFGNGILSMHRAPRYIIYRNRPADPGLRGLLQTYHYLISTRQSANTPEAHLVLTLLYIIATNPGVHTIEEALWILLWLQGLGSFGDWHLNARSIANILYTLDLDELLAIPMLSSFDIHDFHNMLYELNMVDMRYMQYVAHLHASQHMFDLHSIQAEFSELRAEAFAIMEEISQLRNVVVPYGYVMVVNPYLSRLLVDDVVPFANEYVLVPYHQYFASFYQQGYWCFSAHLQEVALGLQQAE